MGSPIAPQGWLLPRAHCLPPHPWLWAEGWVCWFPFPVPAGWVPGLFLSVSVLSRGMEPFPSASTVVRCSRRDGAAGTGAAQPFLLPRCPPPPEPVQMPFTDTQLCNQLITMQMHAPFPHTTSCFLSASFLEIRCFLWECDPSARSHLEPSQPRSPGRLELAPTLSRTSPPWLLKSSCPLFSACLHTLGPLVHPRARSTSWRQFRYEVGTQWELHRCDLCNLRPGASHEQGIGAAWEQGKCILALSAPSSQALRVCVSASYQSDSLSCSPGWLFLHG